jgi:tetratricopeptide (TPR) repeat protein
MRLRILITAVTVLTIAGIAPAQNPTTTPGKYVPGVTYQAANPNYPVPNPFYFEGKIDWELLKITTPQNTWDFAQRGIHKQDDLEDYAGAISDYRQSLAGNSLSNGTCQILSITASSLTPNMQLTPAPCMFTVRQRLANLLVDENADEAIGLYREVLLIDPLHLEVNALIGQACQKKAAASKIDADKVANLQNAVAAYRAELALSPVTANFTALTGDLANNAHVHWELAAIYQELGQNQNAVSELKLYLQATQYHSDTYPWRIDLARKRVAHLSPTTNRLPSPAGAHR